MRLLLLLLLSFGPDDRPPSDVIPDSTARPDRTMAGKEGRKTGGGMSLPGGPVGRRGAWRAKPCTVTITRIFTQWPSSSTSTTCFRPSLQPSVANAAAAGNCNTHFRRQKLTACVQILHSHHCYVCQSILPPLPATRCRTRTASIRPLC